MQFKYLVFLSLSSYLVSAYTTVDQVATDITNLDDAVKALIASTSAYTGGILLDQGVDFLDVEAQLTKGSADSTALPPTDFSVADAQRLGDLVARTLAVDNPRAVNTLESKKALIEATPGQGLIVKTGLQALLAGHLYFSNQVLERTPPSELGQLESVVNVITDALEDGINAFST